MKLLKRNAFALFAAATLMTSCSDDVLNRETPDGENYSVTVYVPNTDDGIPQGIGTRALGSMADWNRAEAQIHNLKLIAYPIKDNQAKDPILVDLLDTSKVTETAGSKTGYKAYSFQLDNGDYRMYVVANSTVTGTESEPELKETTATVPADVESSGVPMACAHNELIVNGTTIGNSNTISVSSTGATANVQADLKFAVSKVRVTLLNDLRITDGVSDVAVSGHTTNSSLFTDNTYSAPVASGSFTPANAYYDMPAKSDTLRNTNVDNLTGKTSTLPAKEWAWQTIFYVPERLVQTSADNTHMDYKIGSQPRQLPIGEVSGSTRKIERSHFYDYVGTPEGKMYLTVQNWDPATIAGALNGPTFLHIDRTSIEVTAGEKTPIWCQTNAIKLEGKCETFINGGTNEELPIYTFSYSENNDTIYVELNRQIGADEIEKVKAEGKWKNFTITAGTINKKVEVKDIIFEEYISVSPKIMTIDVAENKSSGRYSGILPIRITTNMATLDLSKFYIDLLNNNERVAGWLSAASETLNGVKSLYITDKDGHEIGNTESGIPVPESGEVILNVNFNDLNSNRALWNRDAELLLKVSGNKVDGTQEIEEVTIYVRPSYDTYKIHFKAPGWVAPHIYVYQCLELPADHPTHPNAPVGADDGHEGKTAALEYSFTGKVAFKGWYTENNDPNASGSFHHKFWYFDQNNDSWNENNSDTDKVGKHYVLDMDFCPSHRAAQPCGTCKGTGYAKGWPGICMKKTPANEAPNGETDWWEFELSGVATPGKALIMFQDMFVDQNGNIYHQSYANDSRRYPDHEEPGIPLFDYPNKEGWLIYEGRDGDGKVKPIQFTSQRPGTQDTYYTYRIYWPYNASKWSGINVWQDNNKWGDKVYTSFNEGTPQRFRGFSYGKYNNDYAYVEFQSVNTKFQGQFSYQSQKGELEGDYSNEYHANFNSFSNVNGIWSYTLTALGTGKGGKPEGEEIIVTPTTQGYRIYWTARPAGAPEDLNGIHIAAATNVSTTMGSRLASVEGNQRYYEFHPNNENQDFYLKIVLKQDGDGNKWNTQTRDIEIRKSDFGSKTKLQINLKKDNENDNKSFNKASFTLLD